MKELKYIDKVHLDKWDINVKPYLTAEQIDLIYSMIKDEQNPLNREKQIIADVLVCCTDLYDTEDADYSYEQLVYSGLWDDIINECPYINKAIQDLNYAADKYNSTERALTTIANHMTDVINRINEVINSDKFKELMIKVGDKIDE